MPSPHAGGPPARCVSPSMSRVLQSSRCSLRALLSQANRTAYFNPNSICIAQMITSHLSKLPALLGFLTFIQFRASCSLYKKMFCNYGKRVLKPIGTVDCGRLSRQGCHIQFPTGQIGCGSSSLHHLDSEGIPKSGGRGADSSTAWLGNNVSCC